MRFLTPHTARIYALLRIVTGFMFSLHGMQKLFGLFGGVPPGAPAFIIYGAGAIEFVGGVLVALGLLYPSGGRRAAGHCRAERTGSSVDACARASRSRSGCGSLRSSKRAG